MNRHFFIDPSQIEEDELVITGEDVKHIAKVLRLNLGDLLTVSSGRGQLYSCSIEEITAESVRTKIIECATGKTEPPVEVVLLQGLPKGDKLEFIIQKCTELGIREIVPVKTERTVVQLNDRKAEARLKRWQRIALEAAKQSRRSLVPSVKPLAEFSQALKNLDSEQLILIPWEEEHTTGLKQVLKSLKGIGPQKVAVIIGPEGGLTSQEIQSAQKYGAVPVSLGPRILRTETAGMAVVTAVLYELGDLGGPVVEA